MDRLQKGDKVKHISGYPTATMEVVGYEGERVLCKWMTQESEAEGCFLEEKLIRVKTAHENRT